MNVEELDYHLSKPLIAQTPLKNRDQSRLLVLDRKTGNIVHRHFADIMDYFGTGDILMLNDTCVMPARLFGLKEETGAKVGMLMLTGIEDSDRGVLLKPVKRIKVDNTLSFGNDRIIAECIKELKQGGRIMRLHFRGILEERLDGLGEMPLPPYIKERLDDPDKHQTIYTKENGSAATPIAGLCFTGKLLQRIKDKDVNVAFATLYVGLSIFRPVGVKDINDHEMHNEYYQMIKETADILDKTKENGHGIISVDTTSIRTLETIRRDREQFTATSGWIDTLICPGFEYRAIDGLITNLYLLKSTLVMLVSAFSSREYILSTYKEAVKLRYRFFSSGDAMLII